MTNLEATLADGKIYALQIGENENPEGNHVMSLRMSIQIEADSPDSRKEMERFNQKVGGRLFEIRSWEAKDLLKKMKVNRVFDRLNSRYGSGTICIAKENYEKFYLTRRKNLSPAYTSSFYELPVVN